MNYGKIRYFDVANGPGVRVSLFVSGCSHHCRGCFNPETWDFDYGKVFTEKDFNNIIEQAKLPYIEGLSLLGGDPLEPRNQECVFHIVNNFRRIYPDKTIWCYTGYKYEDIISGKVTKVAIEILKRIDVLVDGEFFLDKRNLMLKFCGSENQRLIDVSKSLESHKVILYK